MDPSLVMNLEHSDQRMADYCLKHLAYPLVWIRLHYDPSATPEVNHARALHAVRQGFCVPLQTSENHHKDSPAADMGSAAQGETARHRIAIGTGPAAPPDASRRIRLNVPMTPPSVNHYLKASVRGGFYVSKEARRFKETVAAIAAGQKLPECVAYGLAYTVYQAPKGGTDSDNTGKLVGDALQACGVIGNDKRIKFHQITMRRAREARNARTEIEVWTMAEYVELEEA